MDLRRICCHDYDLERRQQPKRGLCTGFLHLVRLRHLVRRNRHKPVLRELFLRPGTSIDYGVSHTKRLAVLIRCKLIWTSRHRGMQIHKTTAGACCGAIAAGSGVGMMSGARNVAKTFDQWHSGI